MSTDTSTATDAPADEDVDDLEAIHPDVVRVTIDGQVCKIHRLKTREFLELMRILTNGLGPNIGNVRLSFDDPDAIGSEMMALMFMAIPNASQEFAVFLADIVEPVDGEQKGKVAAYLHDNPELDEMLEIFEAVARQEKDDLSALLGKARAMWSRLSDLYTPKKTSQTG